jgi:hypothetical protein
MGPQPASHSVDLLKRTASPESAIGLACTLLLAWPRHERLALLEVRGRPGPQAEAELAAMTFLPVSLRSLLFLDRVSVCPCGQAEASACSLTWKHHSGEDHVSDLFGPWISGRHAPLLVGTAVSPCAGNSYAEE